MHRLLLFLKRKPGMSADAFRAYYEEQHVPLCMKYMAGVERYVRRYVEHRPGLPELDFDVITELWFRDRATLDIVIDTLSRDAMPADVIADEENVFDRARSRFCAVTECETEIA
ncbi:EthD domain-containing protein [Sphingomonas sp. LaA6.9]|uniref:EthD domain-containing protein n=1 Tax=Sphingomonas sp. LaA6.9 TaxID=2919914 RepID=UPI001F4F350E|nr:EthD domain-containing protein [Sphingomonas sp. LaA6.9]MCJ8156093.1 EthD domain-containing protein [Sphingomonas sp. LaA6.9]